MTMKAVVCTKWGSPDALEIKEVEKPTPQKKEILVKIYATTVFAGDCELRGLKFPLLLRLLMRLGFGFKGPRRKILGQELAGEIESIGKDVKLFKEGDQVFAHTGFGMGAYAEYICMPEEGPVAIKPATMTYEEAAAVAVGGLEALHYLRRGNIDSEQNILINGSGGSIGTFAIQLAKYFGAEVTSVDSTGKLDMLRSIGADQVIDYTAEDFTKNGKTYDVIFDVVGKSSFSHCKSSLKQGGRYLLANPRLSQMFRGQRTSKRSGKKLITGNISYRPEDLLFLKELIEAGKIKTVVDRGYSMEQIVEAHRYVDSGDKKGSVVITVEHIDKT